MSNLDRCVYTVLAFYVAESRVYNAFNKIYGTKVEFNIVTHCRPPFCKLYTFNK